MRVARAVLILVLGGCVEAHRNQPPEVEAFALTTEEDVVGEVAIPATDTDGDALEITVTAPPEHGTAAITGRLLTYTPEANYHGPDALVITVYDMKNPPLTAMVDVTVTPVNDAPVGAADSLAANEDEPRTIAQSALLQNDSDIDGDTLTITGVAAAAQGSVALSGSDVVFTPAANFVGAGSFEYTLSDGTATTTVSVTLDIGGANDAPVAVDDTGTTAEDTAIQFTNLVANDTDAEGETLTVDDVTSISGGVASFDGATVTFTPEADFNGTATFSYVVSDGVDTDVGTVTVTVTPVNDAPIAVDDADSTPEDTPITLTNLTGNDTDVETDALTVTAVLGATHGSVVLDGGQPVFTPEADYNGSASFEYTVSDGNGGTDTGMVMLAVTAVNDAPIAVDDMDVTNEDTPITFTNLQANDIDVEGATLSVLSVATFVNCTVDLNGGDPIFTPDPDFFGTASFTYTVSDGAGGTDVGMVTVTVAPVGDIGVASVTPATIEVLASGGTAIATVNLIEVVDSDVTVNLSAPGTDIAIPGSVTVPAGAASATFRIRGDAAAAAGPVTITASEATNNTSTTAAASVVTGATAPTVLDLVINEIHFDIPTANGDANCDGAINADDEFVELVNVSNHPLAMTGVAIWDDLSFAGSTPKFAFPSLVLGAGEAVVVFGGTLGTQTTLPWCTNLDGAHIGDAAAFAGPSAGLALNNSNEIVRVTVSQADKTELVPAVSLPTGADQAYVRVPDITGGFVNDGPTIGATDRAWSPGTLVTGEPFATASP